jgi:hypothetical protein
MPKPLPRMYSLFKRTITNSGRKKYERVSKMGMPLESARRIWQDSLITGLYQFEADPAVLELRPLPRQQASRQQA